MKWNPRVSALSVAEIILFSSFCVFCVCMYVLSEENVSIICSYVVCILCVLLASMHTSTSTSQYSLVITLYAYYELV